MNFKNAFFILLVSLIVGLSFFLYSFLFGMRKTHQSMLEQQIKYRDSNLAKLESSLIEIVKNGAPKGAVKENYESLDLGWSLQFYTFSS